MLSAQKYADILREQVQKTLKPQIRALEDELQEAGRLLAAKIRGIECKLEILRNTDLPAAACILGDYLKDDMLKREPDGDMLALFARGLRTKETQEEILVSLLDNAASCFPCIALFTVHGDRLKGWSSRGFSDYVAGAIGSDEFLKTDCSLPAEALMSGEPVKIACLPDTGSLRLMREEFPGAWMFYPLCVFGRPVAALLAGEAERSDARPKVLPALTDCAALRLENVALKIINVLRGSVAANAGMTGFTSAPFLKSSFVLNLNLTAPIEMSEPVEYAGEPRSESDVLPLSPLAELKPGESTPESFTEITASGSEPEHEQDVGVTDLEFTDKPDEPKSGQPDSGSQTGPYTDDEKLHAIARRFAKLLVYEIRFYNEAAVAEGRQKRDLYQRLRSDINRSREMYEKRIAPSVARTIDYLHEEFIRTLGNGDAGTLGDGYPGPLSGG